MSILQVITDAGLVTVYPLQAEDERGTAILMTRSLNKGHRFAEMRCCITLLPGCSIQTTCTAGTIYVTHYRALQMA